VVGVSSAAAVLPPPLVLALVSELSSLPQAANTSAETATSMRAARALRNLLN
jgi:hypothetical protein